MSGVYIPIFYIGRIYLKYVEMGLYFETREYVI